MSSNVMNSLETKLTISTRTFIQTPTVLLTPSPTVYDIKGSLSNWSSNQKKSMDNWRKDFAADVRNNVYKNIFINGAVDNGKNIALTFDDCPDAKNTSKVLDILKNNGIKASFL